MIACSALLLNWKGVKLECWTWKIGEMEYFVEIPLQQRVNKTILCYNLNLDNEKGKRKT